MRIDWTISALGHAALLAAGLVTFTTKPFATAPESMPIDIVSAKDFSEVMAGAKTAPKAEKPKPLVEKIADKKPVEDPKAKITKQQEIAAAKAEEPPAPIPEKRPKLAAAEPPPKKEVKPEPKIEPKIEPKPEVKSKPEPKADPIADALKKEAAKEKREAQEHQRQERQRKEREQRRKHEEPHFDPSKIAALLDKREAQRHEATGSTLNSTPSLGLPSASAAHLSQSELDALRARLAQLWNPPVGAKNPDELVVRIRIQLTRDGRLVGGPQVLTSGNSMLFMTARDSAIRALFQGQPFDMLRPEHYDQWKDIEITFDPREMMHG